MTEESSQSWNKAGNTNEMVAAFKSFPQWLQTLLSRAEAPGLWQLRDQVSRNVWCSNHADNSGPT